MGHAPYVQCSVRFSGPTTHPQAPYVIRLWSPTVQDKDYRPVVYVSDNTSSLNYIKAIIPSTESRSYPTLTKNNLPYFSFKYGNKYIK